MFKRTARQVDGSEDRPQAQTLVRRLARSLINASNRVD
jgi:hypothetical protein